MSQYQLDKSRAQVFLQAWYQCVALSVEYFEDGSFQILGRCPSTRLEAHHDTKRSAGGGHDPENLIPWCSTHHQEFEASTKITGPFSDEHNRRYHLQDIGSKHQIRKVRLYDFRDFEAELQQEFLAAEAMLADGALLDLRSTIRKAFSLWRIYTMGLWQLDGESDTFGAYLHAHGIREAPKTLDAWFLMARRFQKKGLTVERIDAAIERARLLHGRPATYTALRSAMPHTKDMSGDQIAELIENTPAPELPGVAEASEEAIASERARAEGIDRVCVRGVATVTYELTFDSTGSTEGDFERFRSWVRTRPVKGIDWQKSSFTREVVNREP